MHRIIITGCLLALSLPRLLVADEEEFEEWTSKTGYKVIASYVREEREAGEVFYVFKRQDNGREVRVPAEALTTDSRMKAMKLGGKQRLRERLLKERKANMQSLQEFKYGKAGLKTTRTEFKKLYPDAKQSQNEASPSVVDFAVRERNDVGLTRLGKASCAIFHYLDEELLSLSVVWLEEHLDDKGSGDPCLDTFKRFLDGFGPSTGKIGGSDSGLVGHYWRFEEIDTRLELSFKIGDGVLLSITRLSVESKLPGG